ncbi:hypothetical protein IEQ34_021861 [Dendrobium chrysotoxum]|uniref:Uncharacterized protein n=1 Tax=Dendrobium chrysotoxum TaxID=161865 RepID=A0AAV7FVL0_DENCH|nr:hypothetical protein IEQ34_021861 [Dendrobium chrysotoxum]
MDLRFREELCQLMDGSVVLPSVFVKGRYIGGAEQVLQIDSSLWCHGGMLVVEGRRMLASLVGSEK